LETVPNAVADALNLDMTITSVAARWRTMNRCLVIGRGYNYATALEIALKLKELAYVFAEPFSSADFMHGPFALIEPGFPVVLLGPRGRVHAGLMNVAKRLQEQSADLFLISDAPVPPELTHLPLALTPAQPEWLSPFGAVVAGQLLAYHWTTAKGLDPDHPRHLIKITRTT
jgi:glucosamine--fructose-6-phosphate aminotransferase (isomerizing)